MGVTRKEKEDQQAELPKGFRFHPTDEELVLHYLCRKEESEPFSKQMIADVDIYKFDPWNLPEKAVHGESEWYFFSPRDRKYPNGSRPNRAAGSGFWKATGKDKHIRCAVGGADGSPHTRKKLAVKKTLVFYKGRAPYGAKTNWIMHEYRLSDGAHAVSVQPSTFPARPIHRKRSSRLDDRVLCRIYKKKSTTGGPSMAISYAKFEEVRPDSPVHENSSSLMEEFLGSLPEIEKSELQWFPKLESEFIPKFLNIVDQDLQSTGSVVIDQNPSDDFDDEPSQLDFIDNEENHTLPRTTMMSAIGLENLISETL